MSGSGTGTPASGASSLTVAGRHDAPFLLERVSDPAIEPVTLAEMKLHLRTFASDTDEDDLISSLIVSAREWAEDYTGRALIDQAWRITINTAGPVSGDAVAGYDFGAGYSAIGWEWWRKRGEILLRKSPVIAINSFVTADAAGVETAVATTNYALTEADSKWPRIASLTGSTWATGALKVEFRAGYVDRNGSPALGEVPARFIQAIKLHAEAHYDRDERMMDRLLMAAENLLKPERTELSMA